MKRKDRTPIKVAFAVGAVVIVYVAAVLLTQQFTTGLGSFGSTYDRSAWGLHTYFRYLEALDLEPKTLERFEELPEGATVVVAEPLTKAPSRADLETVAAWVESGGRLVLLGTGAGRMLGGLEVDGDGNEIGTGVVSPVAVSAYTQGIERVDFGPGRLLVPDTDWAVHFKDNTGQGLITRKLGEGEVVWVASPYPVSNAGISRADNARLGVLLAWVGGRDVYFDEYHHGYIKGGGLWERLSNGGRVAVVLGVLALVLILAGPARRLGPPIAERVVPQARTGAYTAALAELYRRAGARREALETLEEGLSRSLARRYGTVRAGLARSAGAAEALERSASVRAHGAIDEKTLTETAKMIGRARQEVEGRHG